MNNNSIAIACAVIVALFGGFFIFVDSGIFTSQDTAQQTTFDTHNATFTIDGTPVTLTNGSATITTADSATPVVTRYFGNETTGDLNGDDVDDIAFLITQDSGGSGTFYYVVAALAGDNGYTTTNAFLIGDRIAPQSTEITNGELHVNFAERKPGEPMSTEPSVGATLLLKVTPDGVLEGLMK